MTRGDGSWLTGSNPPVLCINLAPKSVPSTALGSKKGNLRNWIGLRIELMNVKMWITRKMVIVILTVVWRLQNRNRLLRARPSPVSKLFLQGSPGINKNNIQLQMIFVYRILEKWRPMCRPLSVESCKSARRSFHTRGTGRNRQVCLEPIRRHSWRNHFETGRLKFQESTEIPRQVDLLPPH